MGRFVGGWKDLSSLLLGEYLQRRELSSKNRLRCTEYREEDQRQSQLSLSSWWSTWIDTGQELSSDDRLPATYANFLIINKAVLVPTYNDKNDDKALEILKEVFPKREIIGIDCSTLIKQHGSLHCVTMQYPKL